MLDGIESRIQFISFDIDGVKQVSNLYKTDKENNAFIIVYSISDKLSFQVAIDIFKYIMINEKKAQPIILVGNKSDLVRKRAVSREGIFNVIKVFKYISNF
jgi:GTPase SAR1 family protein